MNAKDTIETAILGGGCFWCVEAPLRQLRGVRQITAGYMGGHVMQPTYDDICTGTSGHAEVVRIEFSPTELSYRDLLHAFFCIHDPTSLNRQGHDVGPQYRSVIFTLTATQHNAAQAVIGELNAGQHWPAPIVTEVTEVTELCAVSQQLTFWPAEPYHQDYYAKNPNQAYCQAVVAPKIAKLRKQFFDRLNERSSNSFKKGA